MRIVKQILAYFLWTLLALIIGIGYMRLVLGPNTVSEDGLGYLLHLFYDIGMIQVGLWVGGTIAFCFILLDAFCLRKKLKNNPRKMVVRLGILVTITIIVVLVHYIMEKVIDVI